ncbi:MULTISPECIES: hypothetical protein [unclassified Caulobacter]|jgi:hypothetical protein|uniref:hypothetical protein n=1 Tax=unclassified Caulobacter TaxID=2648921 RepID=UPI000782E4B6|nr:MULTISPECIES: hypothetical protein [unclassified Caulobacter]AZS22465.1 hypothetical protein CSW63_18600 [Caulobacter sp. FWC26]
MTHKLALLAAAASLTFAGAAFAQTTTTPTPTNPTGPMPPAQTMTPPGQMTLKPGATPADPATPAQSGMGATQSANPANPATPPFASSADSTAAPTSANVTPDFKVGMAVKDSQGVPVGQISGTNTGADGSTNVIVTHGGVKFALPGNSLTATADGGLQTTATKAQIDATVAGAKPQ